MSLPNEAGNEPDILVSARPNTVNLPQFPISSGIFPARSLLPPARRTSRLVNRPSSAGMLPERRLSKRRRFLRDLMAVNSIGIFPVS